MSRSMRNDGYYFQTEALTVGYNGVPLIKNIDIRLGRGEILTMIGPNGAGKTTILKSIMGQLQSLAGTVCLDGSDLAAMNGKELAQKMSVVLTARVRPELMTCEDVVATGRYPYTGRFGVLSAEDLTIVRQSMEMVHIAELADRDFTQISDGQKQRVMLARAICQEPEIILLDEPTSFLDMKYKLEFLSVLQQMTRERGLSVVMSLHELDLAERISDRVLCIKGDKVDRFGTPEEVFVPGYIPSLYSMTAGSYDAVTGTVELPPSKGVCRTFVIAGGGRGNPVFRRLQRAGTPFAAGILWESDLDYPAAKALAAELVVERPYCRISEASLRQAVDLIDQCGQVICAADVDADGEWNQPLRLLRDYAKKQGKLAADCF